MNSETLLTFPVLKSLCNRLTVLILFSSVDCPNTSFNLTVEALSLIKEKLKVSITDRYFYVIKKNIVDAEGEQVNYLMQNRNAYLSEYFETIAEQRKFQREVWELYYQAKADNDRNMQLSCIKQLQDISVYLTNIYNLLPNITGLHFESEEEEYQHQ